MKIRRGVFRWRGWLAAGLTAWAGMAGAVNVVDTPPAQPLADQQLTIGARSLMLPPGNWSYIARSDGFVRHGGVDRKAPHHTAYAMNVNNGRMVAGVVLRLAINSTPVHNWNEEPCNVELALYKDELGGTVKFPECLVIYKRRSHMAAKQDGLYGAAREWAAAQSV